MADEKKPDVETDEKTIDAKIIAGFAKGSAVDQKHRENAKAFNEKDHGGMDESYLEHDDEKHLDI